MAFQFVDAFEENILGFCNNIFTQEGGTHLVGFKTKFTQLINSYARELGILKEKDSNFTGADTRNGMTAVVAVKHPDPIFEGQTKTKLARTLSMDAFSTFKIFPRIGRIAWNWRFRPIFAEPPAESPSTIKISHFDGSRLSQFASFPLLSKENFDLESMFVFAFSSALRRWDETASSRRSFRSAERS